MIGQYPEGAAPRMFPRVWEARRIDDQVAALLARWK
jgi:hypothetical protein